MSKPIFKAIINNPKESRKTVLLEQLKKKGRQKLLMQGIISYGDMIIK
jgi:hypothetical protein